MRWTEDQLRAYELRNTPLVRHAAQDGVELEAPLQDDIESECNRRGWVCVRTRMDKATTFTTPGVADLIIFMPEGRVICVEAKSRVGKQTSEQRGFQMRVERLGHQYSLVRSFGEFIALVKAPI